MKTREFVWVLTPNGIDDHFRPDYDVQLEGGIACPLGTLPPRSRFRFFAGGPVFEVLAQTEAQSVA